MRPDYCYGLIFLIRINTYHSRDTNVNMFNYKFILIMHRYRALFLSILMILWSVTIYCQDVEDDTHLIDDLYVALTLQGINCDGISELEHKNGEGYDVVCEGGGHYSISQTRNGFLSVVDNLTGIVHKGIGTLLGVVPLTGQIIRMTGVVTEHDAEVARSLFSMIELSGNICEAITGIVRNTTDEHIVSCESGQSYRVYTTADGLVAVDAVST